jgi:hypothetical protein
VHRAPPSKDESHQRWQYRQREDLWASGQDGGDASASGQDNRWESRDWKSQTNNLIYDSRDDQGYQGSDIRRHQGEDRRYNHGGNRDDGGNYNRYDRRDIRQGRAASGRDGGGGRGRDGGGGRGWDGGGHGRDNRDSDREEGSQRRGRREHRMGDSDWKTPGRGMEMYSHAVKAQRMSYAQHSDSDDTPSSGESQEAPHVRTHLVSDRNEFYGSGA